MQKSKENKGKFCMVEVEVRGKDILILYTEYIKKNKKTNSQKFKIDGTWQKYRAVEDRTRSHTLVNALQSRYQHIPGMEGWRPKHR